MNFTSRERYAQDQQLNSATLGSSRRIKLRRWWGIFFQFKRCHEANTLHFETHLNRKSFGAICRDRVFLRAEVHELEFLQTFCIWFSIVVGKVEMKEPRGLCFHYFDSLPPSPSRCALDGILGFSTRLPCVNKPRIPQGSFPTLIHCFCIKGNPLDGNTCRPSRLPTAGGCRGEIFAFMSTEFRINPPRIRY